MKNRSAQRQIGCIMTYSVHADSLAHVFLPTTPSSISPRSDLKFRTAASVSAPKSPSSTPEDGSIDQYMIDHLGNIWDAAHRNVLDIATDAGLSQRKLAEWFGIPYRTVEDWCTDRRNCPDYVRLMMQECIGLVHR